MVIYIVLIVYILPVQYIIYYPDCQPLVNRKFVQGLTQKAVTETIHICKDRNILREYLLDGEKPCLCCKIEKSQLIKIEK